MMEQGIRDLKTNLQAAIKSLGEVRALVSRLDRQKNGYETEAQTCEKKAMALVSAAEKGEIDNWPASIPPAPLPCWKG